MIDVNCETCSPKNCNYDKFCWLTGPPWPYSSPMCPGTPTVWIVAWSPWCCGECMHRPLLWNGTKGRLNNAKRFLGVITGMLLWLIVGKWSTLWITFLPKTKWSLEINNIELPYRRFLQLFRVQRFQLGVQKAQLTRAYATKTKFIKPLFTTQNQWSRVPILFFKIILDLSDVFF